MSQELSSQQANVSSNAPARQRRSVTVTLWIVQGLLALLFLFAGSMKLIMPLDVMAAQMAVPLPGMFVRFIGVIEVAGALGLILPGLTRILPALTSLAACGLALEMIGATVVTVIGVGSAAALMPVVVGLLCVAIAYGRRSYFAADPMFKHFRKH
jgi:uncharacterized membrane protein YphA (DoxX/SURF4 family)